MDTKNFKQDDINASDVEFCNNLYDLLSIVDILSFCKFYKELKSNGIHKNDIRMRVINAKIKAYSSENDTYCVDKKNFTQIIYQDVDFLSKIFKLEMTIPEFEQFSKKIEKIFQECLQVDIAGNLDDNCPRMGKIDQSKWSVSVCSVDGQRCFFGDADFSFTMQSCFKPLVYAIASTLYGEEYVHKFVGMECCDYSGNSLDLDAKGMPYNPLINAGSLVTISLIKPELSISDRYEFLFAEISKMTESEYLSYDNTMYLSKRNHCDGNHALSYFLREKKCFPENSDMEEALDIYNQMSSNSINTKSGSVIAATLANGGVSPITNQIILSDSSVRDTLSLMNSSGLDGYSGQFAFEYGLAAKTSSSGCMYIVIPNLMGICCFCPVLDENSNSIRGLMFCKRLTQEFNLHCYETQNTYSQKVNLFELDSTNSILQLSDLLTGAAHGDLSVLKDFLYRGYNMSASDYDKRTALHIAAANGHLSIVKFLIEDCRIDILSKDRWGYTALDEAIRFKNLSVLYYLTNKYGLEKECDPTQVQSAFLEMKKIYRKMSWCEKQIEK